MASQAKGLLSEECRDALNQVASYELHVSDAYLSMACYYIEDPEAPTFHTFFQDQADVKREKKKKSEYTFFFSESIKISLLYQRKSITETLERIKHKSVNQCLHIEMTSVEDT